LISIERERCKWYPEKLGWTGLDRDLDCQAADDTCAGLLCRKEREPSLDVKWANSYI